MLSGIGPWRDLIKHNIQFVHELPGVGQNLQDHLDVFLVMRTRNRLPISLHPLSWLRCISELVKYLIFKSGELSSNLAESGGFVKSSEERTNRRLATAFCSASGHSTWPEFVATIEKLCVFHLWFMIFALYPKVGLSWQAQTHLICQLLIQITGNIKRDIDRLVKGIRIVRNIVSQPALRGMNREEISPGQHLQTDEELQKWVRETAETAYHPVGTCKMGVDDMAVVDHRLRVHGIAKLRVVDCSIMPTLVGGNTNAAATMIGEKAATMILEDHDRERD